ncbi:hypothetical protein AYK25_03380 [Thermoplasmatales archaeon SM1-50]|nr:MAG: hypothetical protein AYK25_03380 [Thermoplasmatales archaeon SM1-50]
MKDKVGIIIGLIVTILVLLTLVIWMMNLATLTFSEIGSFAIIIILVTTASYVIWDRAKNIRKGFPAKDERLINISYKAGYYGFIAAIWSAVFGQVIIDILFDYELEGSRVAALVVIVSGIVFIATYLYMAVKGKNV